MANIPSLENYNFHNKTVLLRVDFNVPFNENMEINDNTRILKALPTIKYLVNAKAKVIIISHIGKQKTKKSKLSLENVVTNLSILLNKKIKFIDDCIGEKVQKAIKQMNIGDVLLLENLRFYKEEKKNELNFAKQLALLADVYVNDAFSCSHRAHASISRIAEILPSYGGFSLQNELNYLERIVSINAKKPITAIIGGAKIVTKIKMLKKLAKKVNYLVVGGAIANNFLSFNKINVGKSLVESNIDNSIRDIMKIANQNNCKIIVPKDVLVASNCNYDISYLRNIEFILNNDIISDIGPETVHIINNTIKNSKTVVWNGPIGIFENSVFANGTISIMKTISDLTNNGKLISIIGGGDSLYAVNSAGFLNKDFTYVSTGGGAFLAWLGGDEMPGIIALQKNKFQNNLN